MQNTTQTILHFHTGRGGQYHNAGYVTFCGEKTIQDVINIKDDRHPLFLNKENYSEIYDKVKDKPNLLELLEKCRDLDDFTEFENKTGLDLGEDVYTDCNGTQMITVADAETGVGTLNWDYEYDTDTCCLLSDCGDGDLKIIAESNEWNATQLVQQYFDENTDLAVEWDKFDGNYSHLIDSYFNDCSFDITDFYEIEEETEK